MRQVLDPSGNVYMTATGGRYVSDSCPDFIYNMNYQVIPLKLGDATGTYVSSDTAICIPPGVWTETNPTINCIPPCPIILPSLDLGYTTTIDFSPLTTSIWSMSGGNTVTKTTTLNISPLTTASIPFWRISILPTQTAYMFIYPIPSFMPPSVVITLASNEATFAPAPFGSQPSPPVFFSSDHPVTMQPQATKSIPISSATIPVLTISSAAPTGICTSGCGTESCGLFGGCNSGSSDDCGTDGCGGGCGIQGCDTTCGLTCSSDIASEPLPIDIDGPDNSNDGAWLPDLIPLSMMNSATQVISSMATSVADAASDLTNDPTNPDEQSSVVNVANSASAGMYIYSLDTTTPIL